MKINQLLNDDNLSHSDFISIQFNNYEGKQYYILKNRLGQKDIVLDHSTISNMLRDSKRITIINLQQLDEDDKKEIVNKIKNYYIEALEIR